MTPTPEDWSYLAGFIDGEGCITSYLNSGGSAYVRIRISQVDPFVLEWVHKTFGGRRWYVRPGTSEKSYPVRNPNGKHLWGVECGEARPFLEQLAPYLKLKRKQAEVALVLGQMPRIPKPRQRVLHSLLSKLKKMRSTDWPEYYSTTP